MGPLLSAPIAACAGRPAPRRARRPLGRALPEAAALGFAAAPAVALTSVARRHMLSQAGSQHFPSKSPRAGGLPIFGSLEGERDRACAPAYALASASACTAPAHLGVVALPQAICLPPCSDQHLCVWPERLTAARAKAQKRASCASPTVAIQHSRTGRSSEPFQPKCGLSQNGYGNTLLYLLMKRIVEQSR